MSGATTGMIGFVAVVLLIMARVPVVIHIRCVEGDYTLQIQAAESASSGGFATLWEQVAPALAAAMPTPQV